MDPTTPLEAILSLFWTALDDLIFIALAIIGGMCALVAIYAATTLILHRLGWVSILDTNRFERKTFGKVADRFHENYEVNRRKELRRKKRREPWAWDGDRRKSFKRHGDRLGGDWF